MPDSKCPYCGSQSFYVKDPQDQYEIFERHIDIKGGGWLEFDFNAMTVKVFGYSTAYGSFDSNEILPLLQAYQPFNAFSFLQD